MTEIKETRDITLLTELCADVQELHHRMYPELFQPFNAAEVARFLKTVLDNPENRAFVAVHGEDVAGYVLLVPIRFPGNAFRKASNTLMIDQLFVDEDFRRKGIATLLLEKSREVAKEMNLQRLELNHWTANDSARALFGHFGFRYFNERMEMPV